MVSYMAAVGTVVAGKNIGVKIWFTITINTFIYIGDPLYIEHHQQMKYEIFHLLVVFKF